MTNGQAPPPNPLPRRVPGSSRLMPGRRPEVPRPRLLDGPAGVRAPGEQPARPELRPVPPQAAGTDVRSPEGQAAGPEVRPAGEPGLGGQQADAGVQPPPGPEPDKPRPEVPDGRAAADPVPPPDEPVTGPVVLRRDAEIERQAAEALAPRAAAEATPSWPQVVGTTSGAALPTAAPWC